MFNTTNYQDGVFSTSAAAGIYVPVHVIEHPLSLDIAARYHWNGTVGFSAAATSRTTRMDRSPCSRTAAAPTFSSGASVCRFGL